MQTTSERQDFFQMGVSCAKAGMSIHANPFRNQPAETLPAFSEWVKGYSSQSGVAESVIIKQLT